MKYITDAGFIDVFAVVYLKQKNNMLWNNCLINITKVIIIDFYFQTGNNLVKIFSFFTML